MLEATKEKLIYRTIKQTFKLIKKLEASWNILSNIVLK